MDPRPSTIGLIGGRGRMGRMFRPLFEGAGYEVLVAGRRTALTYEELVARSDVVIVTVPIARTVETIRRIAPGFRAGQLISDFTSIKCAPVEAMLAGPASVIGCHPIFGPLADVTGQNVVLCPARPGPYLEWYRGLFAGLGTNVRVMTAQAHDEAMAVIQGLTHFIHIAFARTLQTRKAPLEEILAICSPVYRLFFAALCRILSGDPALYAEIQALNERSPDVVRDFLDNGSELLDLVRRADLEPFQALFREAADYLGDYRRVARDESDFLIDQLRRRTGGDDPATPE